MTDDTSERSARYGSRRRFIATTSTIATGVLGGCLESDGIEPDDTSPDTETDDEGNATDSETEADDDPVEFDGEIRITGSSSLFPLADAMAQLFVRNHPDVQITVDATGTRGGFEHHFCTGESDLNGASRRIESAERAHCTDNDVTPVELPIGVDALTVVVGPGTDWVDCVSVDELARFWRDGGAETWADVRDDWPDEEIVRYAPPPMSRTRDWFAETVIGDVDAHRGDYRAARDGDSIARGVAEVSAAIGYLGYGAYMATEDRIDAVRIGDRNGGSCVGPSPREVTSGTYPLSRPLYLYAAESALQRGAVAEFVEFSLERSTEPWIAEEVGHAPATERRAASNMRTLEEAIDE